MKLGKKLLSLGAAAIITACSGEGAPKEYISGKNIPKEYAWRIKGTWVWSSPLYCKSYSIDGETVTLKECYPNDTTMVLTDADLTILSR